MSVNPSISISIHAPLTGSDLSGPEKLHFPMEFQSTLPLRGATYYHVPVEFKYMISIHAPLTGSDLWIEPSRRRDKISIHAPLTGSDILSILFLLRRRYFNPRSPYGERLSALITSLGEVIFQSTLPLRGATVSTGSADCAPVISIHAPLTGSDQRLLVCKPLPFYFNPRSPYRGGPIYKSKRTYIGLFSSTPSLRGATRPKPRSKSSFWISIHAPLTGSDSCWRRRRGWCWNFNPRSPYGERPTNWTAWPDCATFQSTLPSRGATKRM